MGEIKELEEARAIFDLVYAGFHGGRQPHHSLFDNFMKNLKGDEWGIAIVKDGIFPTLDPSLRQVIWQADS